MGFNRLLVLDSVSRRLGGRVFIVRFSMHALVSLINSSNLLGVHAFSSGHHFLVSILCSLPPRLLILDTRGWTAPTRGNIISCRHNTLPSNDELAHPTAVDR